MMNRGDIYWVDLNPTIGSEINKKRPCVLISATPINQARRHVVVIPLSTSAQPRPPIAISLSCLGRQVTAVCDQIRTVDKSRLVDAKTGKLPPPADRLSPKDLMSLEDGLRQVLSL